MSKVYGVLDNDRCHVDVSNTERGAKNYATRNGYDLISVRYNGGYNVDMVAMKIANKWQDYKYRPNKGEE
tara:strand:+ start:271 stop:480 length:210 start_codon:yes stop_codon:yes gene_type:complete